MGRDHVVWIYTGVHFLSKYLVSWGMLRPLMFREPFPMDFSEQTTSSLKMQERRKVILFSLEVLTWGVMLISNSWERLAR